MSATSSSPVNSQSIVTALRQRFPIAEDVSEANRDDVLQALRRVGNEGAEQSSLLAALEHPLEGSHPPPDEYALIAFIDSRLSAEVERAGFEPEIQSRLMAVVAMAASIALDEGLLPLTKSPVLVLLEAMIALVTGTADIGTRAREPLEARFDEALGALRLALASTAEGRRSREYVVELVARDINTFLGNEQERIAKVEHRVVATEQGQLRAERSRVAAARLLNARLTDKQVPARILEFLKGPWFDSMQLIATRDGTGSALWQRAAKLTETLIDTVQPHDENEDSDAFDRALDAMATDLEEPKQKTLSEAQQRRQRLYQIVENLPAELRSCLIALEHNPTAIDRELAAIEEVHVAIMQGEAVAVVDFEPLPVAEGLLDTHTRVSNSLLVPIRRLEIGQWFVLTESERQPRHIRLTLKAEAEQHLVFTSRGGAKAFEASFEEFAYLLSSRAVEALPANGALGRQIRQEVMKLLKEQAKAEQARTEEISRREARERSRTLERKRFLLVAVDDDETTSGALLSENARVLSALKLDSGDDTRLEVGDDGRVRFIDENGVSLGEYTPRQIAALLAGGQAEAAPPRGDMAVFRRAVGRLRERRKRLEAGESDASTASHEEAGE